MADVEQKPRIWCDEDGHHKFEDYDDFNAWLDGDEGLEQRLNLNIGELAQPSKALFAGDRAAYDGALEAFRLERREIWLSKVELEALCQDDHWAERNGSRFDQLCDKLMAKDVVPFIGAGMSQPGGFPTWKQHLQEQWRTAGLALAEVEELLAEGRYEEIVDQIEQRRGADVFAQELRDAFGRNGSIPGTGYLIAELFHDTLITTNYDRLIEQSFDRGDPEPIEVLTPATISKRPEQGKVTIIKLHGTIGTPGSCILSKNQYDAAYGLGEIDLGRAIPKALDYYFRNSSLLFLGCSLNQDRTIQVFKAIKAHAKATGADLPQHFSVEQCPADEAALAARNVYLLRLGITPIWFPAGQFDYVEGILRLARNELRHRRK